MGFFDKVKSFASDAGEAVSKGAKNVSDSSKKMVEKQKLKSQISKMEEEVEKKYAEIGKQYFKLNSENPSEEYADMVTFITDSTAKIAKLQAELVAIDNKYICPNCGAGIPETSKFCPECGSKFEKPVEEVKAETVANKCPECQADIEADAKFCTNCGKKFDTEEAVETVEAEVVDSDDIM